MPILLNGVLLHSLIKGNKSYRDFQYLVWVEDSGKIWNDIHKLDKLRIWSLIWRWDEVGHVLQLLKWRTAGENDDKRYILLKESQKYEDPIQC